MAKPKLCLIPAAQGSKLYSVLPSSGVGDFDFTRSGSATRINSQGLIETVASGVSRLNYPMIDGVVKGCPHHILEPQRLQLIQYSEAFDDVDWIKSRITVSANNIISPDGTLNADKIIETTDTGLHAISVNTIVTSGVSHTFSVFIKKGSSNFIQFLFGTNNVTGNPYVNFDVNQGIYQNNGVTSANIENYGNGWYRCSATFTTSTTSFTNFISPIQSISDSRASSFTGNVNNNFYIYGAMLEEGSYPTSYIPNYGTAAGVTRSTETANGSGDAATFNSEQGVLMAEISALADDLTQRALGISDGTSSDRMSIVYNDGSSNALRMYVQNPSGEKSYITNSFNITQNNKISIKLNGTSLAFWVNGFEIHTDTLNSAFVNGTLNTLDFSFFGSNTPFYGNAKQIQYYDSALNDNELETLTSWVSFQDMAESQLYSIE